MDLVSIYYQCLLGDEHHKQGYWQMLVVRLEKLMRAKGFVPQKQEVNKD